jgi:hypothetical protein
MRRALCLLCVAVLAPQALLMGRSKKLDAIDSECDNLHEFFQEAIPLRFSGPNPWMELDEEQKADPGYAVALVYAAGPRIRWVVMQLADDGERWTENVDYCFAEDGTIARRQRELESREANTELEIVTYYEGRRVLKRKVHHRAMSAGREDSSKLEDPDAPVYWTVDELPFPLPDLWQGVAGFHSLRSATAGSTCVARRIGTNAATTTPSTDSTPKKVTGSNAPDTYVKSGTSGITINARSNPETPNAPSNPATAPQPTGRRVCLPTMAMTRAVWTGVP